MGWNGADLIDDFSAELSDTSDAFQLKVLRWINEGIRDIATSHQWPFLRERGQVVLTANQDAHSIVLATPSAPTLAALAGGSLTSGTEYKVLITFYEGVAAVESVQGTASAGITPSGSDLSITVSSIPVSTCPLVTERRVYLSKGGAAYFYYGTISNNTATTTTITADTTSVITPPEESAIHMIDGDFYLANSRFLEGYTLQRMKYETNTSTATGTPSIWAPVNQESIVVYPIPSVNTTATFYYFKIPAKVFDVSTSMPQIPSWLYDTLRDYVIWRGYSYRDRAGQESKKLNYDQGLRMATSRKGKDIKRAGRIRGVTPDSDGFVA